MNDPRSSPPVFIVGCPRSGTTLLRDLLRSHPELVIAPRETHYIPAFYAAYGDPEDAIAAQSLARAIAQNWRYRTWLTAPIPDEARDFRTFSDVYHALMSRWAKSEGGTRWGDKTPRYALDIQLLSRVFPSARFVNIVRDPVDVAYSLMEQPWGPRTPEECGALWALYVSAASAGGDNSVLHVRYEDLVSDPKASLSRVCAHLELEYSPALHQVSRSQYSTGEATDRFGGRVSRKALETRRASRDPDFAARVHRSTGQYAVAFGYAEALPIQTAPKRPRRPTARLSAFLRSGHRRDRAATALRLGTLAWLRSRFPAIHRRLLS